RSVLTTWFRPHPAPPGTYTLSLHDALPISDAEGEANASSRPPRTVASVCAAARLRDPCVCSGDLGRNHPLLALGLHWEDETWYRSEEHTSELQSRGHLVCRLLLEKNNDLVA